MDEKVRITVYYCVIDSVSLSHTHMCSVLNSLQEPLTPTQQLLLQCLILLPQSGEGWVESISPTHLLQHLTCHEGVALIE